MIGLLYSAGISFAKEPLGSGKSSFEVLPQCLRPVRLSVLYVIKQSAPLIIITYT